MNSRITSIALGLMLCAGCGDTGGNRRNASGSIGGTGLVGSDIDSLAAHPGQPAAPAPPAGGIPVLQPNQPAAMPATAAQQPLPTTGQAAIPPGPPSGHPADAPQIGGSLPGLPGVGSPGATQPNTVTEKAQAGVTGKGNYGPGAVTTPISVYFQAQERLIFLQVQQALNLYEGEHGYKPKTEDEFMKKVIEFNQIRLPQLPAESKYKYDPQKGELLVERAR
jgi:hypothetical protein